MAEKIARPILIYADECHHSASETIANVLKEVKAKYVYGVTATPKRGDGNNILKQPRKWIYDIDSVFLNCGPRLQNVSCTEHEAEIYIAFIMPTAYISMV